MRFLNRLLALQILLGLPAVALHAAVNVYNGASQASGGFNPYTVFNSSANAADSGDNNSDSDDSADINSTSSQPAGSTAPALVKTASTLQTAPTSTANKYVEPVKQLPKAYTPPQIMIKPISPVSPNPAQNNSYLPPVNNLPSSLPVSLPSPAPTPSTSQDSAFLQQIANNTAAINTTSTQLATNWQSSSSQDQQWLQAVTSQTAFSGLESAISSASTTQGQLASNANLVSLQGNWSNPTASLGDNFPYLSSITTSDLQNSQTDNLWTPAVNTALTNLSTEQPVVTAIGQMVNAPFDSQNGILANLQNASTPDLLRALVIEGAINNEIAYQMLQRQQDLEVMQASELAMLTAINNNIESNSTDVIAQEKRIVEVMYNLSEKQ